MPLESYEHLNAKNGKPTWKMLNWISLEAFWPFTVPMSDTLLIYNKLMKLSKRSFHINAPLLLAVMNLQIVTL